MNTAFVGQWAVRTSVVAFHQKLPWDWCHIVLRRKKKCYFTSDNNNDNITATTNVQIPELVLFYNEAKVVVDRADQFCGKL